MEIIARQNGDVTTFSRTDPTAKARWLAAIAEAGEAARASGADDGEVIRALAKGRSEYNSGSMLCSFVGHLASFLGPAATLVLLSVSLMALLTRLAQVAGDVTEWLTSLMKRFWPLFALAGAGAGVVGWLNRDEQVKRDGWGSLTAQAIIGFILGFIPRPIANVLEVVTSEVLRLLGTGQVVSATQPAPAASPAAMALSAAAGNPLAPPALSAAGKLFNWFTGRQDASENLTPEEVDILVAETGLSPQSIAEAIYDASR